MKKDATIRIIYLLFRLWFGYTMMSNGRYIFDSSQTDFFLQWFGKELHFPAPLLMYYLAKGAEFFGGLLIFLGLFSRIAGCFVAFTMLVATLTANIHEIYNGDGAVTISLFCFAFMFIICGSGRLSLDYLIFTDKYKPFLEKFPFDHYLFVVRIWFASLLIFHGLAISGKDTVYIICQWISGTGNAPSGLVGYLAKGIEWVCALSLITGWYTRVSSGIIGTIMLFAMLLFFLFHAINLGGGELALTRYCFWFSVIFILYGPGSWSADRRMAKNRG
jgi:putative oxidoreductase